MMTNNIMPHINQLVPEFSVSKCADSLKFYVDILGFSILYQRIEEGFAFLQFGEAQLMLDEIGKGRTWQMSELSHPFGRGMNLQIKVSNLDDIVSRLRLNAIALHLEPETKWYRYHDQEIGQRQMLVMDPDGYLLRFCEELGIRTHQC